MGGCSVERVVVNMDSASRILRLDEESPLESALYEEYLYLPTPNYTPITVTTSDSAYTAWSVCGTHD